MGRTAERAENSESLIFVNAACFLQVPRRVGNDLV